MELQRTYNQVCSPGCLNAVDALASSIACNDESRVCGSECRSVANNFFNSCGDVSFYS